MNQKAFWSHVAAGVGALVLLGVVIFQAVRLVRLEQSVAALRAQAGRRHTPPWRRS